MIPISKAIQIIKREATLLGSERVDLANALGRVLAENIVADTDLPPFDRSQMDGYAVKADDTKNTPVTLKVVGESAAGRGWHKTLKNGEAVRIMTGAPVPKGADAVQKIELTSESAAPFRNAGTHGTGGTGGTNADVTILEPTEKGRFIVSKGKEVKSGKVVIRKGEIITERNISVLAAFGYAGLKVSKRPRVAILSTGTEIVEIGKKPKKDQIRNSNSVMLRAFAEKTGAVPQVFPIIGDKISDLKSQISDAVKNADILITTGGVSVGKYDLTKAALQELGATILFDRVALKPGKPTVFGKLDKTFVFGLPGNPVSAAVTFQLFVRLMIMKMQGAAEVEPKQGFAVATDRIKGTEERDSYIPSVFGTASSGTATVTPLRWHGSSDFISFAAADVLAFVPKGKNIEKGEIVEIICLS